MGCVDHLLSLNGVLDLVHLLLFAGRGTNDRVEASCCLARGSLAKHHDDCGRDEKENTRAPLDRVYADLENYNKGNTVGKDTHILVIVITESGSTNRYDWLKELSITVTSQLLTGATKAERKGQWSLNLLPNLLED
jgi:hypothetical protein